MKTARLDTGPVEPERVSIDLDKQEAIQLERALLGRIAQCWGMADKSLELKGLTAKERLDLHQHWLDRSGEADELLTKLRKVLRPERA